MNAHTKQQEDKVFEMYFIDSQKSDPPFVHLLALSHYIYSHLMCVKYTFGTAELLKENLLRDHPTRVMEREHT